MQSTGSPRNVHQHRRLYYHKFSLATSITRRDKFDLTFKDWSE